MAPKRLNRKKVEKACKAMKTFMVSEETVESTLKQLLEVYDNNWTYIEEENYRVLVDAIFDCESPKTTNAVNDDFKLHDESEEEEAESEEKPLVKKARVGSSSNCASEMQQLVEIHAQTETVHIIEEEDQCEGVVPMLPFKIPLIQTGPSTHLSEKKLLALEYYNNINNNENENENMDVSPCSSELSEMQHLVETHTETVYISENRQREGMDPIPPFENPLTQPAPPKQSNETDSVSESLVEENKLQALEFNNIDNNENENENVDVSPCSSEIDVASSCNGEVNLAFAIRKPPQGFHIPNINAVLNQVEDMYREKFQLIGTEISISGILKDLCQCFVEQGNNNSQNKLPIVNDLKEPEEQGDEWSLSNALVSPSDYVSHQVPIPKFVVSSAFKHVVDVNGMQFDRSCFSGMIKKQQDMVSSLTIWSNEDSSVELSRSHYFVADITRGLEKQEISLINEFNDEMLPAFTYIQNNVNYNAANVKFSLARISDEDCCSDCFGDCLSLKTPCACAAETEGEFAYTIEGSLKKEFLESSIAVNLNRKKVNLFYCDNCPLERMERRIDLGLCKGHLTRKFIKECWLKCGCGLNCGNRVVQRGIQANLQVFMTPEGKGWGLRSLEDLAEGTFVCEYVGEILTNSELFDRYEHNEDEKYTYHVLLDADWSSNGLLKDANWSSNGLLKDDEALCLDATSYGNVARFINHRCKDANLVAIPVEVESPDHHYYHHAFFTTRAVKAMEELTWDYGIDFNDDDSYAVNAFKCKCGSKSCQNIKFYKRKSTILLA
ncbi:probable inactive histone-lysine N-methyltransferase SUVR2 [Rutidosis leptorrhynchoides]|uniref:probable inactive histone-lysine N-methyltransferase SUVR2 n=1 Tax=Rutidosis leptorrhynchoides TaxID=125765 RepID=UPI003A98D7E2